jgi:CRISPR-associated protein Csh1
LFSKSETKDKSYNRLEAFLQKTDSRLFQKAIANFFAMYKHKNMTDKFGRVFSQVMNYETEANMKDFLPEFLSGFFDYNKLFSVNEQEEIDKDEITEQENEN